MKIGIMTYWWSKDNYGQVLQCFALQKYLRNLGHDAFLIRYSPGNDYCADPGRVLVAVRQKSLTAHLLDRLRRLLSRPGRNDESREFSRFHADNIQSSERVYHHYRELLNDPPIADIYICGSDQIWNYPDRFRRHTNLVNAYFLNFGDPGIPRIACAASFGRAHLPAELIDFIRPLLRKFSCISVREKSGLEICSAAGRADARWTVDPVVLLDTKEYTELSSRVMEGPKYILVYLLGSTCSLPRKQIVALAQKEDLEIRYVGSQAPRKYFPALYPTIPEWLSLVMNAEFVITNSLHGTLFSIMYKRNFTYIPLTGLYEQTNERVFSLLERLDSMDRIFTGNIYDNYYSLLEREGVDGCLSDVRSLAREILRRSIG